MIKRWKKAAESNGISVCRRDHAAEVRVYLTYAACALVAGIASVACVALKGAEKTAASDFTAVRADAVKVCKNLPELERLGVFKGQAAKDAEEFCAAAEGASSVTVVTPLGSASASVPAVGGAPDAGVAP